MGQRYIVCSLLFLIGLAGCTTPVFQSNERGIADSDRETRFETENNASRLVDPDELVQGCPEFDCIPSIDNPSFIDADEAGWLHPEDRVIGVTIDGKSRAYPFSILTRHEIVNDELAGVPIAVTYCPLCRSGFVYERQVDGRTLEFGVSGKLLNANLVMYDRETESLWGQLRGQAIIGPLSPTKLSIVTSEITEWKSWRRSNPSTSVLSRDTGIYPQSAYESNPYDGYGSSGSVGFGVSEVDDRLEEKALVYGISENGTAVAFPVEHVEPGSIVTASVSGRKIAAVRPPDSDELSVFDADGLANLSSDEKGIVSDDRSWGWDGTGRGETSDLERVAAHGMFWFAWSKFHPDTRIATKS